jgi:hypothetical protein
MARWLAAGHFANTMMKLSRYSANGTTQSNGIAATFSVM